MERPRVRDGSLGDGVDGSTAQISRDTIGFAVNSVDSLDRRAPVTETFYRRPQTEPTTTTGTPSRTLRSFVFPTSKPSTSRRPLAATAMAWETIRWFTRALTKVTSRDTSCRLPTRLGLDHCELRPPVCHDYVNGGSSLTRRNASLLAVAHRRVAFFGADRLFFSEQSASPGPWR